jgi:hypothetical protein
MDILEGLQVYLGSKFCPSVLETVRLIVPARYIRNSALFNVCPSYKNCPSANAVCRNVDVFEAKRVFFNHTLHVKILFLFVLLLLLLLLLI